MICPRCGANVPDTASECPGCGMPTVFMDRDDQGAEGGRILEPEVLEPEVLESLDAVDRPGAWGPYGAHGPGGAQAHVRPLGCTLGPGCGCIALPLMALAGVVVSSVIALLWVLSLGRLPASLLEFASRARRGFTRS